MLRYFIHPSFFSFYPSYLLPSLVPTLFFVLYLSFRTFSTFSISFLSQIFLSPQFLFPLSSYLYSSFLPILFFSCVSPFVRDHLPPRPFLPLRYSSHPSFSFLYPLYLLPSFLTVSFYFLKRNLFAISRLRNRGGSCLREAVRCLSKTVPGAGSERGCPGCGLAVRRRGNDKLYTRCLLFGGWIRRLLRDLGEL